MIEKLKDEIIQLLQQREVAHLALNAPDGPWASVVRFTSAGLTLYLIEPRASDLVFYIENSPHVALTITDAEAGSAEGQLSSIQLFGSARVLAPHELHEGPDDVQTASAMKNRLAPGIYVVIEVKPNRIYCVRPSRGTIHQDTIDIDSKT
jgi:nitroimidazol reductase NimA-like FMN-containing flavoprotein (pyridoxamine 5'-phosphate oxidase superfamily)